ncbi:hypothetical protein MHOL44478_07730 [Mycobacterium holsaticum DSM 44478]|nr:hypothetical protein [Mycolicibacterium holsaticum DSM 44478 = JCM 12374]
MMLKRTAIASMAALLVASGAAMAVAPAHAGEKDDQFIEYLDQKGVPYSSKTEAIRVAKDFCLARTRQNAPKWRAAYHLAHEQGWTETEAAHFAEAAIPTYCPRVWK